MLTVTGIESRDDVRLIKKYAYFCLTHFVANNVLKKSHITIKFVNLKDIKDKKERREIRDYQAWMEYSGTANGKRKFVVTLSADIVKHKTKKQLIKYKETLKNLGHEIVHIKQYLNNEMFDYTNGNVARFRGDRHSYTGEDDWTYWEAPYEIEAYGRSEGLWHMFKKMLKEEEKA